MSRHNEKATEQLKAAKITPSMIIAYMRNNDDGLGIVTADILSDDDMAFELAICQTKAIWNGIHDGIGNPLRKLPVCNLHDLATSNGVLAEVYGRVWSEFIGDGDSGISHAASAAYEKLDEQKLLTPDASVVLPLVFKNTFLPLMKALLLSRVIAKAPLKNASDIRALHAAKVAFQDKGYQGNELMKLLIITHRLWTPKRMQQFATNIPAASV